MLDPAPRIVIDPELGMLSAGRTMPEAELAGKIAVHTMTAIMRAEQLEAWQPLNAPDRSLPAACRIPSSRCCGAISRMRSSRASSWASTTATRA